MEENGKQKPRDFKDIKDKQERLIFQLSSTWDREPIDSQKIMRELHKLKLMQAILYPLIIFGIIAIFIFILQGINLLIIIIDIIIVAIYLISLKYIYTFRKSLKITKKELKPFIKLEKKCKELTSLQIFLYLIIIFTAISILIISMIGIDPLIMIIMIAFSIIYIYFDKEFEDDNTSNI